MPHQHALLLNADYRPVKVISWERAISLILEDKADLVIGYVGEFIRSVALVFERPAVVRLRRFAELRARARFNRANVLARDDYTCVYCGLRPLTRGKPDLVQLTLDHVVPRAQGRNGRVFLPWAKKSVPITCWENVITACYTCNNRKADRTPAQAGLQLRVPPRAPSPMDLLRMSLTRVPVPREWDDYIPEGWRGYWTDELDES